MAQAKQFFDYLSSKIDISPAGSEEELQAAHTLEALMKQIGLATKQQEFDTRLPNSAVVGVLYTLVFAGTLLAGFPGFACSLIGFILLALGVVGLYSKDNQTGWLDFLSKGVKSQNVIGFHKASGSAATGSARKIIIVSHYDSGHIEMLANAKVARYAKFVHAFAPWGILVAAICVFLELFVGMAPGLLVFLWIAGMACALPSLVLGVNGISSHFGRLAGAANDNNASLAAMLGVAADVSAHGATFEMPEDQEEHGIEEKEAEPVAVPSQISSPELTRHGINMIRELAILPKTCEIEYVDNVVPGETNAAEKAEQHIHDEVTKARVKNVEEDKRIEMVPEQDKSFSSDIEQSTISENDSGESLQAFEPFVKPELKPFSEAPEAPFENRISPAQRVSLFDLPDPEKTAATPLSSSFDIPVATFSDLEGEIAAQPFEKEAISAQIETISADVAGEAIENPYKAERKKSYKSKKTRKRLFGGKKKKQEDESMSEWLGVSGDYDAKTAGREINNWDNFGEDDLWKGGATRSDAFADKLGAAEDGELADAVVRMDDVNLMAHDIYFVAVGASEIDNAGIKAFLDARKKELRGAYVFTLDAIGAGELTIFANEAVYKAKRATRRILKTFDHVARDLHISLMNAAQTWMETETKVVLDHGVRGVTLMGCEPGEVPALVHTAENTTEHVNIEQIEATNRLLDEVIRRV